MRTTRRRLVPTALGLLALLLPAWSAGPEAQPRTFTLEQVLGFPFPSALTAAPTGSPIAWTLNERGVRSVWVTDGETPTPRRLFSSEGDDGQELTGLAFSGDARHLVYVRGGAPGSNFPAERGLMPNPAGLPVEPKMQVWSVRVDGGRPRLLGDGSDPVPSPDGERVVFSRGHELWDAPIDGSSPAARLFFARGSSGSPAWSPDGRTLAFVSDRGDVSYIGLYTSSRAPIAYLAPASSRDSMPRWSPDGTRIAFVRQPGRGGPASPPLASTPQPWAIWTADVETGEAWEVWRSPDTFAGSYPRVDGGAKLMWGAGDRLVFLSYHDGWPHLYAVPAAAADGGAEPLTPGAFAVEDVTMTPDRRTLVYTANTGDDEADIDRRHVFTVPVEGGPVRALTSGAGIEWSPVVTGDGERLAYIAATAEQPPLPVVRALEGPAAEPQTLLADRVPADFPVDALVTPESVVITAPDGTRVYGQLFLPPGGAAPSPGVVFVHGGPRRQMLLGWHYGSYYARSYAFNQYLASRGYVVLSVNFRLGIGYGFDFQHPPDGGVRGAGEYQDVLAAGHFLQARSEVNPARIGIWGGSYGGYLTALGLARNSDVFAAGVDIHGVHTRLAGIAPANQAAALAGDGVTQAELEEAARVAWESSPAASIDMWRSPVLLVHGDDDRNVRVGQTVDLVQRLAAVGVPFEELIIPDEVHNFLLHRSWVRVLEASADFFDRHLGGQSNTED